MFHKPVLLKEVIKYLNPQPGDFVIDGTVNGGGHAIEILKYILPGGKFLGLDLDRELLAETRKRIPENPGVILEQGNYADLPEILKRKKLPKADGLLLDLGFSSEQVEGSGRGFSFAGSEPLLMTFDPAKKPVKEIIRDLTEKELAETIFRFSGEKFAGRIARSIKNELERGPVDTTAKLREAILRAVPKNYERGRIDPATRTFQALRIYANDELVNLEKILRGVGDIVKPDGRAAIISFHSLEDRIVKNSFRDMEKRGQAVILTKKPARPSAEEMRENPRSRSAKLRAIVFKI